MATIKQKKLAKVIIENTKVDNPLNAGQMLEKVGYSKSVAEAKSADIINSEGVKQALNEYGFSEDNAMMVVSDILLNEEERSETRLNAAKEVFKVHGTYAAEKSMALQVNVEARLDENPATKALMDEYKAKLKAQLTDNEPSK